jgi:hypothetical protein
MAGLSTDEIMQIALTLAGFSEVPEDSGIHVPGRDIQKVLFSMDVNVGLIHMARQQGFDAVIGHHPCGVLLKRGEVFRRHVDLLERQGIARETIVRSLGPSIDMRVRRMENQRFRMLYNESPNQTVLEVDAARFLGLPFMNVHNPLDETGRRILQAKINEKMRESAHRRLSDVVQWIEELSEAQYAREVYGIPPGIFVGDPDAEISRVVFVHGALAAPDTEIIKFYWQNGIDAVIVLHAEFEALEKLKQEKQGSLVCTGHFLGDSIGMTPFITALRDKGLEVVCMGGIIDTQRSETERG